MSVHVVVQVTDISSVGEARRALANLARSIEFSEADTGRASIVLSELATNIVRHAQQGQILLCASGAGPSRAMEITSIDKGPGMADINRCFTDGFSTGGTPGNGLGAIRRLSDAMDLCSSPAGTTIWARITDSAPAPHRPRATIEWAVICVPAPGETVSGDTWRVVREGSTLALVIADGLGHGPSAFEASDTGCRVFDRKPFARPEETVQAMHDGMSGTRGAAVAVAILDLSATKVTFAGVGNIAGWLQGHDGHRRGLFSHNGTVGHKMHKLQELEYPWNGSALLVMHSDGLQTRWNLADYPGLSHCHPAVIAGVLFRDFVRGRDDVTIVVVKTIQSGAM